MAGKSQNSNKLNHTLYELVKKFGEYNVTRWFISYGTLLGIVREGSCIDGDDDIDVCLHVAEQELAKVAMDRLPLGNWMSVDKSKCSTFMRREESPSMAPVDVYVCSVNESGDFDDKWEGVVWTDCYSDTHTETMEQVEWKGIKLNVPKNYIDKLAKRYGPTWVERVKRGSPAGDGYRNHKSI